MALVLVHPEELLGDAVVVTAVSAVHEAAEATVSTEQNGASAPQDYTTETSAVSREPTQKLHHRP